MESGMTKPSPLSLSGNVSANWNTWKSEFDIFMIATDLTSKPDERKKAIFLNLIGREGREVAENFNYGTQPVTVETLSELFAKYCNPRKNTIYMRYKLWSMIKLDSESVDQFATRLIQVARDCDYGDQQTSIVRDRIVFGIKDDMLRERILEMDDIPLQQVIDMVRANETTKEQMKSIKTSSDINIQQLDREQKRDPRQSRSCFNCGSSHGWRCPAYGKRCNKCQTLGHFAVVCSNRSKTDTTKDNQRKRFSQKKRNVLTIDTRQQSEENSSDEVFMGSLGMDTEKKVNFVTSSWCETVSIHGNNIKFRLDTGAEANVIPLAIYNKLGSQKQVKDTKITLNAFGGHKIVPKGIVHLTGCINSIERTLPYFIADVESDPVLGLHGCQQFKLIKRIQPLKNISTIQAMTCEEIVENYKDVFTGIGCFPETITLEINRKIKPVIHAPRKIPISLNAPLKETLKQLQEEDIIKKVTYPTPWVNSLVIRRKKNGQLRLCIDPRDLNKALLRQHYKIPTSEEIYNKIAGKQYYTIIDQNCGYWNIKLSDESSNLCTFNTPFGRYRFCRLPFGLSVAPEIFQQLNDTIFGDLQGVGISTDDFIIGGDLKVECVNNLLAVLERAREANIKFNVDKIQFCRKEVKYLGNIVSGKGITIDPTKLTAIDDLKPPKNKSELRSLLGFVNYLMPYIPNLSESTSILRSLNTRKTEFIWDATHDECLKELKQIVHRNTSLVHFDPTKAIIIQCDASQNGLGACLLQDGRPVSYTSRALHDHETRYSQIEKEFLAITNACERFHYYIYGYQILVHTDHKPLVSIMNKSFEKITPRLQRFVLRLQRYNVILVYRPGTEVVIADLLSRNYSSVSDEKEGEEEIIHQISTEPAKKKKKLLLSDRWHDKVVKAMETDEEVQACLLVIKNGWPRNKREVALPVRKFWPIRDRLRIRDKLLLLGDRLFIPRELRTQILELLHEGHQGIEKSKRRARQLVYWPGITRDVELKISSCASCQTYRNNNAKEPLIPHEIPDRQWQKLAIDIFELDAIPYLLIVDYYSKYPEIVILPDQTAMSVIAASKSIFARHGIPNQIICDNMPFGSQAYRGFCHDWDIELTTSSPRYPRSNGMAKRFVQSIKSKYRKALMSGTDPDLTLLEYRNTPIDGMSYSPAQLLMSRSLRAKLPVLEYALRPKICKSIRDKIVMKQNLQKKWFDQSTKSLRPLQPGQVGRFRQGATWRPARILTPTNEPRSYLLTNEQGNVIRRNRSQIITTGEEFKIKKNLCSHNDNHLSTPNPSPVVEDPQTAQSMEASKSHSESTNNACTSEETSQMPVSKYVTSHGRVIRPPLRYKDFVPS